MYISFVRDIRYPDLFWFIPYQGTKLCKWDLSKDTFEYVDAMTEGLRSIRRPQRYETDEYFFSNGVIHENKLVLSPNWGNKFVQIDIDTDEASEWVPPFDYTTDDKNDYWKNWGMGYFYLDSFDWTYKYFYAPEHIIYDLDLEKNTAAPEHTAFDKEDVFRLASGFHRESQWMPYVCFEDVFNSLNDIAAGNIHGPAFNKDHQTEAYRSINASPDGDCGEKVFRYLKRIV